MASASKVELVKQAIKQLIEEVGSDTKSYDDDNNRLILSKLMSQLEKLEGEEEGSNNVSKINEAAAERILKEVKKVRRQNVITHCLLSLMIVLTVAWQISEVSIILKLKDGVAHPFRSLGSIFMRMIKPRQPNIDEVEPSITSNFIESTPVHDFKVPMLPHLELPNLDLGFDPQD